MLYKTLSKNPENDNEDDDQRDFSVCLSSPGLSKPVLNLYQCFFL